MRIAGNCPPIEPSGSDHLILAGSSDRCKGTTNMDLEDFSDVLGVERIDREYALNLRTH